MHVHLQLNIAYISHMLAELGGSTRRGDDIKGYVWSAFIMNYLAKLIPGWLSLVVAVAESEDLRLNFLHETLMQNKILRVIKKSLAKKCLGKFAEVAETSAVREGVKDDLKERDNIMQERLDWDENVAGKMWCAGP